MLAAIFAGVSGAAMAGIHLLGDLAGVARTHGSLTAKGTKLGDFVVGPGECLSGARFGNEGVRLVGAEGGRVHVRRATVTVEAPGSCSDQEQACARLELDRERCERFELRVDELDRSHNKIKVRAGELRVQCRLEQGVVSGTISFPECV